ncbi:hypothetical protein G9A89_010599 [Geosiphon pyriformis]|nr:hypothetical protein G9A89_010599 [Geosiphon pyriformis]
MSSAFSQKEQHVSFESQKLPNATFSSITDTTTTLITVNNTMTLTTTNNTTTLAKTYPRARMIPKRRATPYVWDFPKTANADIEKEDERNEDEKEKEKEKIKQHEQM